MHREIGGEKDGERKGVIDTIVEMKKKRKKKEKRGHSLSLEEAATTLWRLSSTLLVER